MALTLERVCLLVIAVCAVILTVHFVWVSPGARQVMWRHFYPGSEPPPTLGVRDPRQPKPPDLSPGYALPLPEPQDAGEGAGVTEVVAPRGL